MDNNLKENNKEGKKTYIVAWGVCVLGMLGCIILKGVFKADHMPICIVIAITTIIYALILTRIKCDIDELKYKAILIFSGITKFIFIYGCTFENSLFADKTYTQKAASLLYAAYIVVPILEAIELYIFYKNKKSEKLKMYIIVCFWVIYYLGVVNIYSFWSLMILLPVLTAFSQFEDVKLMVISGGVANLLAMGGACRQVQYFETGKLHGQALGMLSSVKYFFETPFNEENGHTRWMYIIVLALLLIHSGVIIRITQVTKKTNKEKIDVIADEQSRVEKLTDKIIGIGMKVKTSTFETNKLVNDLDAAIKNSSEVLDNISEETKNNFNGIEEQTKMTHNISKLIENVVEEVNRAEVMTGKSLEGLNKSKRSFEDLKNKSSLINENNNEVIQVIDEFVENARQVKNITEGIAYISDETNLLSLNASIKSIRAGDVGKGFAVVAGQIRILAKETAELTDSINNIVDKLEKSAYISQKAINEVVDSINEENHTIDNTIQDFDSMEKDIKGLSSNVNEISNRVSRVSSFNNSIENHIGQMMASSENVITNTSEAETLNKDNKSKIEQARNLMNNILVTADKMDEVLYMKEMGN